MILNVTCYLALRTAIIVYCLLSISPWPTSYYLGPIYTIDKEVVPRHCKSIDWLLNSSQGHFGLHQEKNDSDHGCRAPLHEECPKHRGHKGDPGVTPETCGAVGERAQVILVWVRAPDIRIASHLQTLGVTRVRPSTMCSSWREDSRMLKSTSIGDVS